MKRETVRISTPAGEIEAWVYLPNATERRPAVVLGCGVGAVKAAGLDPFASAFCEAGYVAIAFDYLGFGGSGGLPRHVVIVWDEYRDFKAVVNWARRHDQVDASQIVVWGTSFGGMHVTRMLAEDHELAAGIAQCPCVDAALAARMKPIQRSLQLTALAIFDWVCSFFYTEPVYVYAAQSAKNDRIALMDAPDVATGWALLHKDLDSKPVDPHSNQIAARSVLSFPFSRPVLRASQITAPYLIVLPEFDSVAPMQAAEEVVRKAAKGEMVRVPGGHFDLYKDGVGYKNNLQSQLAFLERIVPVKP